MDIDDSKKISKKCSVCQGRGSHPTWGGIDTYCACDSGEELWSAHQRTHWVLYLLAAAFAIAVLGIWEGWW